MQKSDVVWTNLNAHNYGPDLKPINFIYSNDDPSEVKDKSVLPRFKLSTNQETFELMFKLIDKLKNGG